jgi:pimeloyl-ACP methyl ester carboxylesterase
LQDEIRKTFKIRATYLYGHSQGSFFSFLYAGAYEADVQGLVGQASGPWGGTATSPKHFHQAVVLMHGTADPVVPYVQSVGGLAFYRDAKYPMAHLRSLEGWNHWPHQSQTAMELAWCEGMTSDDPERVAACFDLLDKAPDESGFDRDLSAMYGLAKRVATLAGAPDGLRTRAAKAAQDVEDLAKRHVDAIAASLGKGKGDKVADAAWIGHLPTFLRDFDGVPACDAMAKDWADRLAKHKLEGVKALKEYYRVRQKEPAKALAAGVAAVRDGFLWCECMDANFLKALGDVRNDAKLKLAAADAKAYDDVVVAFTSGRKKGLDEYAAINKKQ